MTRLVFLVMDSLSIPFFGLPSLKTRLKSSIPGKIGSFLIGCFEDISLVKVSVLQFPSVGLHMYAYLEPKSKALFWGVDLLK